MLKLGIYYHIPLSTKNGIVYAPGYFGIFLDELAAHCEVYGFFYEDKETTNADYPLVRESFTWINLGPKPPAWRRELPFNPELKIISSHLSRLDVLLVRSPTPLASRLFSLEPEIAVVPFVIGDYGEGAAMMQVKSARELVTKFFLKWSNRRFVKNLRGRKIIVNSPGLAKKYESVASTIDVVRTTTLSKADIFLRTDTCNGDSIKLLYTGRIDWAKGFKELIGALAILRASQNIELHIVGWEDDEARPVEKGIKQLAEEQGVEDLVYFHGKKTVGPELNKMYQMADIYVIPSYHEGFPRTIWEAMANGLPVVASAVGAIPEYLKDEVDALLIKPKDVNDLSEGIKKIISNARLRKGLIEEGYKQAEATTIELVTQNLINSIKNIIK